MNGEYNRGHYPNRPRSHRQPWFDTAAVTQLLPLVRPKRRRLGLALLVLVLVLLGCAMFVAGMVVGSFIVPPSARVGFGGAL